MDFTVAGSDDRPTDGVMKVTNGSATSGKGYIVAAAIVCRYSVNISDINCVTENPKRKTTNSGAKFFPAQTSVLVFGKSEVRTATASTKYAHPYHCQRNEVEVLSFL